MKIICKYRSKKGCCLYKYNDIYGLASDCEGPGMRDIMTCRNVEIKPIPEKYPDACPRSWFVTGAERGDGKRCQRQNPWPGPFSRDPGKTNEYYWLCGNNKNGMCAGRREGKEDRRVLQPVDGYSITDRHRSTGRRHQ